MDSLPHLYLVVEELPGEIVVLRVEADVVRLEALVLALQPHLFRIETINRLPEYSNH